MAIEQITVDHYNIPLPVVLSDSTHGDMTHFGLITVRLRDSDGVDGMGYTYTVGNIGGSAVASLLRGLLEQEAVQAVMVPTRQPHKGVELPGGFARGRGKARDARQILGSRAPAALLPAAAQQRFERQIVGNHQRPDARRAADLVGRQAHELDPEGSGVERDLAGGLNRVAVDRHPGRPCQPHDLGQGLDHPGFVVGQHYGDQRQPRRRGQ